MDTTSVLRLLIMAVDLSKAIEQKIGDCIRRIDSFKDDLTALSLKLQLSTKTFTTAKVYLEDLPSSKNGSSQAQKDALAALLQALNRCEEFFKDLHPVFIGIERLKENKVLAEAALRSFVTAGAGLRAAGARLDELHEHVQIVLFVLRVHGSVIRRIDDVLPLINFRKKPVRYGVDGDETIRLHTLVAKTIWAAQVYGVKSIQTNALVGADVLGQIEAWTALSGSNDTTDLGQQRSDLLTTVEKGNVEDDSRETGKNAVQPSTEELYRWADLDQRTTGPNYTIQDQTDEILPGDRCDASLISNAQYRLFPPLTSPSTRFHDSLATSNQHTVEVPIASATKAHTAKITESVLPTHRRASFKVWAKKWYKPR